MFTLDIAKGQSKKAMFITYGDKRIGDLDLWHKKCGHINIQRLKDMDELMQTLSYSKCHLNAFN